MNLRVVFCFGLLAVGLQNFAAEWKLIWADEFSSADGAGPSSTNWVFDLGSKGWGNNELQTYTNRRENARIENGHLVIETRREKFTGIDGDAREFTSARLKSKGKQQWTYGRIEARIKVPRGQGIWPAFWMLSVDDGTIGWPDCGEIDIMENVGKEPTKVHGTVHGPGYSGAGGIGGEYILPGGKKLADDFHTFAIEWEPNRIRWFCGQTNYFTLTPDKLPAGKKWVFDKPQFLLLNVAVGGDWPGNPDATTEFPQKMLVDYVRVYQRPAKSQ